MLKKALEFYFVEEYFYGTDTMILWFRKAVKDLAMCDQSTVKGVAEKIESKLNGLRQTENYY